MTSLRRQLTRALVGVLAVLFSAALVGIYVVVWDELVDQFDATLRARAIAISAAIEVKDGKVHFKPAPEILRGYSGDSPRNFFILWDADNQPIARSPSKRDPELPRRGGERLSEAKYWNLKLPGGPGRAIGYSFVPGATDGSRVGKSRERVQLVVAADCEELEETLAGLGAAVVGAGLLLLGAVWLVVPLVLRRGLRPVETLSHEVSRIDADSLAARLSVEGLPAELRPIGDRLNDLLARLAAAFERERRFSADVAHELRTPLAELRSLAECALKWPDARDPATDREVLAISAQMEALTTRMLTLARGERGQLVANLEPVDAPQLIAEAWRPFAARAAARSLEASFTLAPATVRADPALLRAIVANLFDNALAHAPAGANVRVTGEATPRGYVLRFANPAGELTTEDVARLFERFWRKEASRAGAGEHVGLGLSLARMFAAAMGWRLGAALDAEGSLVFTLDEPAQ